MSGTLIPIDEGDPRYTVVPAGVCGYAVSMDPPDYCGKPILYRFRIKTWRPNQVAGACAEHGAEAREKRDLEWIRSA
jgi:hypothetical protein